jgi:hypothetical protein
MATGEFGRAREQVVIKIHRRSHKILLHQK